MCRFKGFWPKKKPFYRFCRFYRSCENPDNINEKINDKNENT